MTAKLIAITQPVIEEAKTASELITYCARVSNPSNQANTKTAPKLLQYLLKHKHYSPFEMAHLVIEIETTRDIARQILRHRSFAFQEFSGRYAVMPETPVLREARLQDDKNRQNSIDVEDQVLQEWWQQQQATIAAAAQDAYQQALERGIAKEVARAVLPEGNTVSRLYMSGSVRSWIHYIAVRLHKSTQKEHRAIAAACLVIISEQFPELAEMLPEYFAQVHAEIEK